MSQVFDHSDVRGDRLQDLQVQVMAAEMHLTHFASRHGKESPIYRESLQDFANAWHLLKQNRSPEDFLKD